MQCTVAASLSAAVTAAAMSKMNTHMKLNMMISLKDIV